MNMNDQNIDVRLESLGRSLPADPGFSAEVLARIEREQVEMLSPSTIKLRRWINRSAFALAACIVLALGLCAILVTVPNRVYAMEEIANRLQSLDSLHLKGTMYANHVATPVEVFLKRPDRCRINGIVSMDPSGRSVNDVVTTGAQRITVDQKGKAVVMQPENPIDATIWIDEMVQQEFLAFLGSPEGEFKKVRSEKVGEVVADVLENRLKVLDIGYRREVWMNPATQLPIKTALFMVSNGKEQPVMEFTIEPNASIPDSTFEVKIPEGYAVKSMPAESNGSTSHLGDYTFSVRYLFNIDNRAVLACWALYDNKGPAGDLALPDKKVTVAFRSNGAAMAERLLRAEASSEGYHWRWSLLTPSGGKLNASSMIDLGAKIKNAEGRSVLIPVCLPDNELDRLIQGAQRVIRPGGNAMTLQEIRSAIEKGSQVGAAGLQHQ